MMSASPQPQSPPHGVLNAVHFAYLQQPPPASASPGKKQKKPRMVTSSGRGGLGNIHKRQLKSKPSTSSLHSGSGGAASISGGQLSPRSSLHASSITSSKRNTQLTFHSDWTSVVSLSMSAELEYAYEHEGDDGASIVASGSNSNPSAGVYRSSSISAPGRLRAGSVHSIPHTLGAPSLRTQLSHPSFASRALTDSSNGSSSASPTALNYIIPYASANAEDAITVTVGRECPGAQKNPAKRTGRGGAGNPSRIIVKNDKFRDMSLYPTTAALVQTHEDMLAAQERAVIEKRRAEAKMLAVTGRGGSGNINSKKLEQMRARSRVREGKKKSKEPRSSSAGPVPPLPESIIHIRERESRRSSTRRSDSPPPVFAPENYHTHARQRSMSVPRSVVSTQTAVSPKKKGPGLKKLWRKVTGNVKAQQQQHSRMPQTEDRENTNQERDFTPVQNLGLGAYPLQQLDLKRTHSTNDTLNIMHVLEHERMRTSSLGAMGNTAGSEKGNGNALGTGKSGNTLKKPRPAHARAPFERTDSNDSLDGAELLDFVVSAFPPASGPTSATSVSAGETSASVSEVSDLEPEEEYEIQGAVAYDARTHDVALGHAMVRTRPRALADRKRIQEHRESLARMHVYAPPLPTRDGGTHAYAYGYDRGGEDAELHPFEDTYEAMYYEPDVALAPGVGRYATVDEEVDDDEGVVDPYVRPLPSPPIAPTAKASPRSYTYAQDYR